jgi:hypothetical protein
LIQIKPDRCQDCVYSPDELKPSLDAWRTLTIPIAALFLAMLPWAGWRAVEVARG